MSSNNGAVALALVVYGIVFAVVIGSAFGYFKNIYEMTRYDFEKPYKAEIVRGIGVLIPVFGTVIGYVDIDDE